MKGLWSHLYSPASGKETSLKPIATMALSVLNTKLWASEAAADAESKQSRKRRKIALAASVESKLTDYINTSGLKALQQDTGCHFLLDQPSMQEVFVSWFPHREAAMNSSEHPKIRGHFHVLLLALQHLSMLDSHFVPLHITILTHVFSGLLHFYSKLLVATRRIRPGSSAEMSFSRTESDDGSFASAPDNTTSFFNICCESGIGAEFASSSASADRVVSCVHEMVLAAGAELVCALSASQRHGFEEKVEVALLLRSLQLYEIAGELSVHIRCPNTLSLACLGAEQVIAVSLAVHSRSEPINRFSSFLLGVGRQAWLSLKRQNTPAALERLMTWWMVWSDAVVCNNRWLAIAKANLAGSVSQHLVRNSSDDFKKAKAVWFELFEPFFASNIAPVRDYVSRESPPASSLPCSESFVAWLSVGLIHLYGKSSVGKEDKGRRGVSHSEDLLLTVWKLLRAFASAVFSRISRLTCTTTSEPEVTEVLDCIQSIFGLPHLLSLVIDGHTHSIKGDRKWDTNVIVEFMCQILRLALKWRRPTWATDIACSLDLPGRHALPASALQQPATTWSGVLPEEDRSKEADEDSCSGDESPEPRAGAHVRSLSLEAIEPLLQRTEEYTRSLLPVVATFLFTSQKPLSVGVKDEDVICAMEPIEASSEEPHLCWLWDAQPPQLALQRRAAFLVPFVLGLQPNIFQGEVCGFWKAWYAMFPQISCFLRFFRKRVQRLTC